MRNSLRTQLIIIFVLVAAIPLMLMGYFLTQQALRTQRTQALEVESQVAKRVATEVEAEIHARVAELDNLVNIRRIQQQNPEEQFGLLSTILSMNNYEDIALVDGNGSDVLYLSRSRLNVALTDRSGEEAFRIPEQTGEVYFGSVQFNDETNEPLLTISLPLFDLQNNRFDGVLLARFRFKTIWDLMQQVDLPPQSTLYLIDDTNRIVAHQNPSVVLRGTEVNPPQDDAFTTNLDGEEVAMARTPIVLGRQTFSIIAEQQASEALALANTFATISILTIIGSVLVASASAIVATQRIANPIKQLVTVAETIAAGEYTRTVEVNRQDEIGTLGAAFNSMASQLRNLITGLEQRVASRTQDLNLAAEIGRQVSQVRNLDELLPQAAQLVQDRFALYQTQIYLVDETGEQLVLQASTGHAGAKLLEDGHALPIDENSLNGTAVATKQAVIVADTAESPAFRPHPLLPDTRSEMVVPLLVGENVVGVLDLQSDKPNALSEDNLPAFTTLSGQLAIAIQNAALLNERRQAEAQVRENEALMRTIINSTPDWIFVKDLEHRYLVANKEFADTLAMTPDEIIGKNDLEVGIPEVVVKGDPAMGIPGIWPSERRVMDSGQMEIVEEETVIATTGQHMVMTTTRVPLKDTEDNVVGFVGFIHDITERKQFERELEEAHTRTQEILESINVPLVISRVSDGIVAYVNEPLAEIIRVPRDELIGQTTPDFYHDPADRDAYLKGLREQGQVANFDLHLKRGDGDTLWTLVSGRVINFQGEPAIISSLIDVTDRREAQATVARRATELETVANVSAVASAALEPDELMEQVVDLTKARFNLYHAHLYLLNENKTNLILTSGAGEIGTKMVAEGRRISMTQEQSLVARAARTRTGVVINDVQAEPGFLPHPLLPETRAEMAVPLVVGEEVLGVLDVQADSVDRFTSEDINIFTTLASQIAVALQNARRHNEALKALDELTRLQRIMVHEGWEDYLTTKERPYLGYAFNNKGAKPIEDTEKETVAAKEVVNGTAEISAETNIPISVRGELIGKIALRNPDGTAIPERKQSLIKTVAHQVSEALERARLTEQTQQALTQAEKRSQEMGVINNIVTQISTSLDLQHSLQIVVDELATAVNVDQVRVALIQPGKKEMLVIAEHYDSARATSAVGMTIPIEGNELTQNVIKTRQVVVVEDAQNDPQMAPVHDLFREQGIETVILMPLVVNDEVIGTLGMDILDKRTISEEGLKLAETIVFQTATAIQNARLFEQIQATLAETEMLYSYSSQLNTATSLDAVLESAAEAGLKVGAAGAMLLVYDRNTTGNPEYAQIAATVPRDEAQVGQRIDLQEQPGRYLWPTSGQNTVFVGDIAADDRLSPEDQEAISQQGMRAMAIMYLSVGNLRLGQILIHWNKAQTFTNADERLYGAIAQQASSVVYNRLLFNQTEEALSETAALYQASADLNTAQTFDEVLTALRQHTILGQGSGIVAVNYFNRVWEKGDIPEFVDVLARWTAKPVEIPRRHELATFPEADILFQPHDLLVSNDIAADTRLGEQTKQFFDQLFGAKSMIFVPLLVGNQWVGFVNGLYPQTTSFSEEQLRRLNVLVRQAAVTIQSIRLYEQTQEALAQTEALYTGSERIVLASTEDDILQSLIVSTELRRLDRASLFMFDHPVEDRVARDVTVVATWVNEGVPPSVQVGTRFEVARVPFLSTVNPDESLVINDIRNDSRVDGQTRQILESYGMISFVMIPIVVGSQWLGMISGQSAEPMNMTDVQMRQANSLVGQAAVVMQTTILFRQEQARARREHLLREIAAKVRNSTDIDTIMQTAVTEIGRTLGRRSFIKLGDGQNGNARAGTGPLSQRQNENENGAT
ncbi:MAG: hypothetical protein CL608_00885 [Anaerolineaceae bacterium]|nr:hypothetical protein [Anaerolineaceae bacterium]